LIGSESITYEQFTGIQRNYHDFVIQDQLNREYFAAHAEGNADLPGFLIEDTGGRVRHGTCLVMGFDILTHTFGDGADIRGSISHYSVPDQGAY
jgi:hypothetical protein